MAKNDAALVSALNDLLQLDHDAIASYQVAIDALTTDALKRRLRQFRREHQRHVTEIAELVTARGGTPVRAPHVSTGMLKLAVQSLGAVGGERAVLLAFRTNEWESAHKYARTAARRFPPEVREVVQRGAADEAKHYRWAVETLAKLGAGDATVLGRMEQVMERVHGGAALGLEAVERLIAAAGSAPAKKSARKTPAKKTTAKKTTAKKTTAKKTTAKKAPARKRAARKE